MVAICVPVTIVTTLQGSCHVIKRFIDNSASAATLSKVHHKSLTSMTCSYFSAVELISDQFCISHTH